MLRGFLFVGSYWISMTGPAAEWFVQRRWTACLRRAVPDYDVLLEREFEDP